MLVRLWRLCGSAGLALLVALLLAPVGTAQAALVWQIERVDTAGDVGEDLSMALDSAGHPHISYHDKTNGTLKYARYDGAAWHTETLDTVGGLILGTSIAIDSQDRPQIAYHDGDDDQLKRAIYDGQEWTIQIVADGENVGWYPSLALDDQDHAHIAYIDEGELNLGDLRYAHFEITQWVFETIEDEGDIAQAVVAIDAANEPHIAYVDDTRKGIALTVRYDPLWVVERIDTEVSVGGNISMVIDSDYDVHIAYDDTVTDDLKYALDYGSGWRIDDVDTEGRVGIHASVAVDSTGQPHISYFDIANNAIKYASHSNVGGWQTEIVDPLGEPGSLLHHGFTSLAFDSQDQPYIAYRDTNNRDLKYATLVDNTPPSADAGGPYSGGVDSPISLDGAVSDPDADDLTTTWSYTIDSADPSTTCTFGNAGGAPSGPDTTITCDNYGTFILTLQADDGLSPPVSDTATLTISNVAPSVTLGDDVEIDEGDSFSGGGSFSDPDQSDSHTATVNYGDGAGEQPLAHNPDGSFDLSHDYLADDGQYTVEVCVTDDNQQTGCDDLQVTVLNIAPTVSLGEDVEINEGATFSDSGAFTDPGVNDTHTATVDYGDGSGEQPLTLNPDGSFALSHDYPDDGQNEVEVCVTDDDQETGCDDLQVTVLNIAPTVTLGEDVEINEGDPFSANGSFSDPGSNDTHTASVDYGDGAGSQELILNLDGTFSLSHDYLADDGLFDVEVCVEDDDLDSSCDEIEVTVLNVAPTITDMSVELDGSDATVTVSATDPAGENDPLSYAFDCDRDGDYEVAPQSENSATCTFFRQEGTFFIGIQISDGDGGLTTDWAGVIFPTHLCASDYTGVLRYSDTCGDHETAITLPDDLPVELCANIYSGALRVMGARGCSRYDIHYLLPEDGPLYVCVNRYSRVMRVVDDLGQCSSNEFWLVIAAKEVGDIPPPPSR